MSGIYIPGERIPDTLTAFWVFPSRYVRVFGKNGDEIRGREAIPVPEHGRLIDADAMQEEWYRLNFDRKISDGTLAYWNYRLSQMPTIIPADPAKEGEG